MKRRTTGIEYNDEEEFEVKSEEWKGRKRKEEGKKENTDGLIIIKRVLEGRWVKSNEG